MNGPLLDYLITDFLMSGGKIEQVPAGSAIRDNDGENWKTINENNFKIRQDKQQGETA